MLKKLGQKIHTSTTIGLVKLVGVLLRMHPKYLTNDGKFQLAVGFLNTLELHSVVEVLIKNRKNSAGETATAMREKIDQKFLH